MNIAADYRNFIKKYNVSCTYNTYLIKRNLGYNDKEISKLDLTRGRGTKYTNTYAYAYKQAREKGLTKCYSWFYQNKTEFMLNGKIDYKRLFILDRKYAKG